MKKNKRIIKTNGNRKQLQSIANPRDKRNRREAIKRKQIMLTR